jgi:hypothetical protein
MTGVLRHVWRRITEPGPRTRLRVDAAEGPVYLAFLVPAEPTGRTAQSLNQE